MYASQQKNKVLFSTDIAAKLAVTTLAAVWNRWADVPQNWKYFW
jgi:hypothetical protein